MPRVYVPKPGAKRYKKYEDSNIIQQALEEIAARRDSLSNVARKYGISKSVLCRHKNRIMKPHGRLTALSKEEEQYIIDNLNICGDWGYPLDTTDLRYIIKMYLDSMNIKHTIFKNNIPGVDYVNGFLNRNADKISARICQNIKRARAAVSSSIIKEYFIELEKSLEIFEDYIKTIVLPFLEKREGKKILIGDNLSSHLSLNVIKLCQEKDIHLIFLPANSTHLTQPLDVAVFRPMKIIWRHLLDNWKKSDDGRTQSCVPKGCFPMLLKLLMEKLQMNGEKNIKAGFKKCGIVPLDANQVLTRLPMHEEDQDAKVTAVNDSFLKLLNEMRYGSMNIREPKKKRKLEVVAGRSVNEDEVNKNEDQESVKQKKNKKIIRETNASTPPFTSLKGKGIGKKTKLKIDTANKDVVTEIIEMPMENEPDVVIPVTFKDIPIDSMPIFFIENYDCQEITVQTEKENENDQIKNVQNYDCQEIAVQTKKENENAQIKNVQNYVFQEIAVQTKKENKNAQIENVQNYDFQEIAVQTKKENKNTQIKNAPNSEIKIISDVKLKLPLPSKKKNSNFTLNTIAKSNPTRSKREKCMNVYKDANEILKILEKE